MNVLNVKEVITTFRKSIIERTQFTMTLSDQEVQKCEQIAEAISVSKTATPQRFFHALIAWAWDNSREKSGG